MASEVRHRSTAKKKQKEEEEEIVQAEEEDPEEDREEEEKLVKTKENTKAKTRTRAKKEEDQPVYASKTIEYTVAIVRVILILVVFTVLHGWVSKYLLDPFFGRDQNHLHFTCPEGMDCQKIRDHIEKVHFKG